MRGTSAVAEIAAVQRTTNARQATGAIGLLNLLSLILSVTLRPDLPMGVLLAFTSAGQGAAYLLVRSGRSRAGVLVSCAFLYIEQIGVMAVTGELGPIPYLVTLVMLLVAATAEARWLPLSFLSCLLVLAIEGRLSGWSESDQGAIITASLFTTAVFVVSLLHVRGTKHAFDLAERQDAARAVAAAAAMDSERRYRLIADSTDDLIALVDGSGVSVYLSPSHRRVLGVDVEAMVGRLPVEFLNIENINEANQAFIHTLEHGDGRVELRVRRGDGTLRMLEAHMTRVESANGTLVAIISRDVSERRDLEMRLHASERLEALGRLAGSVAHDFNNLLTVIAGASELARRTLPAQHPAMADLDTVLGATGTATDLARQLLTFSRRQLLVRTHVDLASVLQTQRELLTRMVGKTISLEYDFEDGLPTVLMPRAHVEQLAMNLAGNARDAMPTGGRLIFTMRRRLLGDRVVADLVAGEYLVLEVKDQGVGISDDVLPHLFEPFFSTKGARGTGLGLATCFGIVAQAGGTIRVESVLARGTAFRVFLPAATAGPPPALDPRVPREVRRVLVVDDDASVREMTSRMLRSEGHEVHTAATLAEARQVLDDHSVALDAMLTDVVLGNESGMDLIEPCHRARPQARIVVTSGYTPDSTASESLALYEAGFLPKPFSRNQLLDALRGV
jgi:two-component system, cell cycle sensor histidine kinase and response regulator CckA